MATLSQIRDLVRVYISQSDPANSDFTNPDLTGFINEGLRFLAALVKKPIDRIEVQLEVGKPAYTLPSDTIILLTAYYGDLSIAGDVTPLSIITEEALRAIAPSWLDESSSSRGEPAYAVLIDRRTVLIYPTPDTASGAGGKKLHVGYVYQPPNLVADGDEPDLPIVYHDLVSKYAAHLCFMTKLKEPDRAVQLLEEVMTLAKKHEELIVKDAVTFGFTWGRDIDPDDEWTNRVNP